MYFDVILRYIAGTWIAKENKIIVVSYYPCCLQTNGVMLKQGQNCVL